MLSVAVVVVPSDTVGSRNATEGVPYSSLRKNLLCASHRIDYAGKCSSLHMESITDHC